MRRITIWLLSTVTALVLLFSYRTSTMVKAVLHGDGRVHHWCRVPWGRHVLPYLEEGVFFIRYEDLLEDAEAVCRRVLEYLGLERDLAAIRAAIDKQSFENTRDRLVAEGDVTKIEMLRSGGHGNWREELTSAQRRSFDEELGSLLRRLSAAATARRSAMRPSAALAFSGVRPAATAAAKWSMACRQPLSTS